MDTVISADQTVIVDWTSGDGPPLVAVHGTTADHTTWRLAAPLLEPHLRVHAMDRRGRGGSGDAPRYALEREFEDVAAVLRACAEAARAPVDLIGHSFGGLCALGGVRLAEDAVRRVLLYEPPIDEEITDLVPRLETLLGEERREEALELFFREAVGMPGPELDQMRASPVWPARVAAVHTVPRELRAIGGFTPEAEWFTAVKAPTLLLLGGASPRREAETTERLRSMLPDARIEVLPGQRHVATITAPEMLAAAVTGFLAV